MKSLLESGANPTVRNNNGRTVEVGGGRRSQLKLMERVKYALGLGEREGKEMADKPFVELTKMLVPKWDREKM